MYTPAEYIKIQTYAVTVTCPLNCQDQLEFLQDAFTILIKFQAIYSELDKVNLNDR